MRKRPSPGWKLTSRFTNLRPYGAALGLDISLPLRLAGGLKRQSLLYGSVGDGAEVWSERGRLLGFDQRSCLAALPEYDPSVARRPWLTYLAGFLLFEAIWLLMLEIDRPLLFLFVP